MSKIEKRISDLYVAHRFLNGVRASIALTAKEMALDPLYVCDILGFDHKWAAAK